MSEMTGRSNPPSSSTSTTFSLFASLFSTGVGSSVLLGWLFQVELLKSWLPGRPSVRFNAALCFVLLGFALWTLRKRGDQTPKRRSRLLARIAVTTVVLVGLVSLSENIFGWNLGLDHWLYALRPGEEIGNIASITALDFVLLGCALLVLDWKTRQRDWPAQFLAVAAGIASLFGLLDFLLGLKVSHTHIALPTAVSLAVLSLGVICARPEWVWGGLLASQNSGVRLLRRALVAGLLVINFISWLESKALLTSVHLEWEEVSVIVVIQNVLLIAFILWAALIVDRAEQKQRKAEEALGIGPEKLDPVIRQFEESPVEESLRRWGVRGIALAVLLTGFMGFLSWRSAEKAAEDADWVAHTHAVIASLEATLKDTVDVETGARGFVATGSAVFLQPYEAGQTAVHRDLETLRQLIADNPGEQRRMDLLERQINARIEIARRTVAQMTGPDALPDKSLFLEGKRQMDAVRATVVDLQSSESTLLDQRSAKMQESRRSTKRITAASTLLGVVLLLLAGFRIGREIDNGTRMRAELQALNANLEQRVEQRTAELCKSEENYRTVFESMVEGFCTIEMLFDQDGKPVDYRFLEVNPAFERQTGIENAAGRRMREIAPLHEEHWFQLYGNVALTGEPISFENEAAQLHRWYEVHAFPVGERRDKKVGITFSDITERRMREEELRESEERFRLFIEHAPAALAMFDREMRYLHVSHRWRADYGIGERDLLGVSHYDIFPELPERWKEIHRRALAGEVLRAEADRFDRADGIMQWIRWEVRPWHDRTGAIAGIVIFAEDITERKLAEVALRESEARFQAMANGIPQLAWMAEPDGHIFWYNQRWYEYTGTTFEQMEGWAWQSVHDPEMLPRVLERWKGAIATGQPFDMEFPLRGADGAFRAFLTRVMPLKDAEGCVTRWFGTNTDISERKQAEHEIRRLNDELEQRVLERTAQLQAANQEMEAFTYSVSHDLRAPLRHISGFSRIMSEEFGPNLPPDAQHNLRRIQEGTQRMGLLVDDLLNLARVSRIEVSLRVAELRLIVDELIAELAPESAGRQIEWKIGELPFVKCDPGLIKQVLQNLLSNALKFTRPRKPAVIEIGQMGELGDPVVFVRDNGVGFNMKYTDKLFGVFQRLHRTEDFEGTGVGLATVQRIIHKHNGRIWAEAELDKGATFYFTWEQPRRPKPKQNPQWQEIDHERSTD